MLLKLMFIIQFFTAILTNQILTYLAFAKIKISGPFQSVFSSSKASKNAATCLFYLLEKDICSNSILFFSVLPY